LGLLLSYVIKLSHSLVVCLSRHLKVCLPSLSHLTVAAHLAGTTHPTSTTSSTLQLGCQQQRPAAL